MPVWEEKYMQQIMHLHFKFFIKYIFKLLLISSHMKISIDIGSVMLLIPFPLQKECPSSVLKKM